MSEMRDAAARAVVFQVLEYAAKNHKDAAKAELAALEPGDTLSARWDGQLLGKATKTSGRSKLVVTDERKLLQWLEEKHPTEIIRSVNPAYLKSLEDRARRLGTAIDIEGEVIPGVELQTGEPYVSVRREKDAPFIVAQLLSAGRVSLEGIKELEG